MDTKDFLKGFSFASVDDESIKRRRIPAAYDATIILSVAGKDRKTNRHEICFLNFFTRIEKNYSTVAVGIKGKEILFCFDMPELEEESLKLAPSTKSLNSKQKVVSVIKALGVTPNLNPNGNNIYFFKLTHAFGNIYRAEFDLPKKEIENPAPSSKKF